MIELYSPYIFAVDSKLLGKLTSFVNLPTFVELSHYVDKTKWHMVESSLTQFGTDKFPSLETWISHTFFGDMDYLPPCKGMNLDSAGVGFLVKCSDMVFNTREDIRFKLW